MSLEQLYMRYQKNMRVEASLQEHLFEHFNSEGHNGFLLDVSVTLIDKSTLLNKSITRNIPTLALHGC